MCYDIKASLESQLKRARSLGDSAAIEEIEENLAPFTDLPLYHANGFQTPELLIYTDEDPFFPCIAKWGLVPFWAKDFEDFNKINKKTLNARSETMFAKPSYRESAKNKRCIIYVDGFYEHHHYKKNTYPYYIFRKDGEPMALAGLWSEWKEPERNYSHITFTIVTTKGNALLTRIHNNPKLSFGPRMPFILDNASEEKWLSSISEDDVKEDLKELVSSYPDELLDSHTVAKIRGKNATGNKEEASKEYYYPELITLF